MNTLNNEIETIKAFVSAMDQIEKQYGELFDRVGALDKETSDMLHDFEFDHFYRTEGHRKARRLQTIRQERRAAKNKMELLYPIREFVRSHQKLKVDLHKVVTAIKKVQEDQKNRVYIPRVCTDMAIANKHFENKVVNIDTKKIA